jgi:hypothetical protein
MKYVACTAAGIALALACTGVAAAQAGGDTGAGKERIAPEPEKPQITAKLIGLDASLIPAIEVALKSIRSENAKGERVPAISVVKVQPEKGLLSIHVTAGTSLRLTQITKALEPMKVEIARDSLTVAEGCKLSVDAKAKGDDRALRDAIDQAKLFERFDVKPSPGDAEYEVTVEKCSGPATHGAISKAISRAGEYEIADITWTSPEKGTPMPEGRTS